MSEREQALVDELAADGSRSAVLTLVEAVRHLCRYDLNGHRTVIAGWPARDALPTTDPEDC